ncbi:hypothetical protein EOM60_02215 [Candidatus Saccharibacteria bacterium]|nr:hypothetical protein [Candidatus Saccharibacteria bacterium]
MKNQTKTIKHLKIIVIINAALLLVASFFLVVLYNGYFNLQEHTNNSINALVQNTHRLDVRIQELESSKSD